MTILKCTCQSLDPKSRFVSSIDLPLIYHCCCKSLRFSSTKLWYHVNFPLKSKLGLNNIFNCLLETTHELHLLVLQRNINTEKHSQHHIKYRQLFWVWKPPDKTQDGKLVQQSDMNFILWRYGTFTINRQIHPTWRNEPLQKNWTTIATQHTFNAVVRPPLRSCTDPYGVDISLYGFPMIVWLPLPNWYGYPPRDLVQPSSAWKLGDSVW